MYAQASFLIHIDGYTSVQNRNYGRKSMYTGFQKKKNVCILANI